jgi:hypothetical protein
LHTVLGAASAANVSGNLQKNRAAGGAGTGHWPAPVTRLLSGGSRNDGSKRCMVDVADFIAGYAAADEARIRFAWNGQHADAFVDHNLEFRVSVREAVLADVSAAPIELIRDLFRAETQFAREAWCVTDGVGVLAEALLRRGGATYLDDYLEGKFQCFDAMLGSAFDYDLPLARTMLDEVRARLAASLDSPKSPLWQKGQELFAQWLADREP